ncbi:hypothetical protein [Oceanospirillum linum]|uniref:Uncharacterized protein n=1 Tax=Oceanospirillum linum TaxID=966 RepID=A0A1T1HAY3_OCELI|nr:hypothetical protein [Oceanospirillum linum]OOV87028.1 hypothetical protein BTA35_0208430 [Oceanospirillum linum]SEF72032.1 hypothetical protein SAMN04489856_10282 [Oleiphilus messinensis]SMP15879.1 hypothetical protein SAMN06264348_10380 [Oceanospirillum linum]
MKSLKPTALPKLVPRRNLAARQQNDSMTSASPPSACIDSPAPRYSFAACSLAATAFGLVLYGIFSFIQSDARYPNMHKTDECHYLSHLDLAGAYQYQKDGSVRCLSPVRYLGVNNQHTLRYMALGRGNVIEEMRISLRLGRYGEASAVNELVRFGQSLSLPVLGHTMPAEVGQYLREGYVGHWDFPGVSLYIERHYYPALQDPPNLRTERVLKMLNWFSEKIASIKTVCQ